VVVAARGPKRRELAREVDTRVAWSALASDARLVCPGVLALEAGAWTSPSDVETLAGALAAMPEADLRGLPLIVVVDDAEFTARTFANFLWVTFTRSNPAVDVGGVRAFTQHKAWGCHGPLLIDARSKPHHAPPLVENADVTARVDRLFARGATLAKWG
jgi:4-hydroxy-3-polyprenylbenzoate decarboxylase